MAPTPQPHKGADQLAAFVAASTSEAEAAVKPRSWVSWPIRLRRRRRRRNAPTVSLIDSDYSVEAGHSLPSSSSSSSSSVILPEPSSDASWAYRYQQSRDRVRVISDSLRGGNSLSFSSSKQAHSQAVAQVLAVFPQAKATWVQDRLRALSNNANHLIQCMIDQPSFPKQPDSKPSAAIKKATAINYQQDTKNRHLSHLL